MANRPLILLPATAAILIGLLAGCAPTAVAEPSPTPSDPAPTPTAEPSDPATTAVPIDADCETLVSPDAMYAYNPNFGWVEDWEPEDGTDAADAVDLDGVACQWLNQTSGDTIDLSVASLDPDALEALMNEAVQQSTMVPTYGDEAYFEVADGIGTAIVFDRSYWLVVSSGYFLEPGDATEIVESALTALP
jgi:hypothetical protein